MSKPLYHTLLHLSSGNSRCYLRSRIVLLSPIPNKLVGEPKTLLYFVQIRDGLRAFGPPATRNFVANGSDNLVDLPTLDAGLSAL